MSEYRKDQLFLAYLVAALIAVPLALATAPHTPWLTWPLLALFASPVLLLLAVHWEGTFVLAGMASVVVVLELLHRL